MGELTRVSPVLAIVCYEHRLTPKKGSCPRVEICEKPHPLMGPETTMKPTIPAAALGTITATLCLLTGCAMPIRMAAHDECKARVQRISEFGAAYIMDRENGLGQADAEKDALRRYPHAYADIAMTPGATQALTATIDFIVNGKHDPIDDTTARWADCGPTPYLVFGAGGYANLPPIPEGNAGIPATPLQPLPTPLPLPNSGGAWSIAGPGGTAAGVGGTWAGSGPSWAGSGASLP